MKASIKTNCTDVMVNRAINFNDYLGIQNIIGTGKVCGDVMRIPASQRHFISSLLVNNMDTV